MSPEWKTQKISSLGEFDRGKSKHRPRDAAHLYGGPYPFIQTGDVTNSDGRITNFRQTYSEAGLAQSRLWPAGTLAITIAANIAETALLTFPACFPDSVVGFTADPGKADVRFIEYLFQAMRKQVKSHAYGSAQENINLEVLRKLEFPIPPLPLQTQIADYLSVIDDRITLLRETNATLEAIAQALFKSWFVDFDPVRAKMEGRAPEGMDEATAALFPDSFEETELGVVPRGWRVGTLGSVCGYLSRGISPKYLEVGGVLVLNQKCIRDFSVDCSKGRRHDPAQRKTEGREVEVGDVLVNSTGVGTLGRVAQVLQLSERTIVDSHVTIVRAGPTLSWPYLGQFMTCKQSEIEAMGEGSTGQTELSRGKLAEMNVPIPDAKTLNAFNEIVIPLKQRIATNESSIQTLSTLRDTLLPRLISGQLRLPEAVAEMENLA